MIIPIAVASLLIEVMRVSFQRAGNSEPGETDCRPGKLSGPNAEHSNLRLVLIESSLRSRSSRTKKHKCLCFLAAVIPECQQVYSPGISNLSPIEDTPKQLPTQSSLSVTLIQLSQSA